MKPLFVAAALALAVPNLGLAAGPARIDEFVEIVRNNDCKLKWPESDSLLTGFSGAEIGEFIRFLENQNTVEVHGPRLTLKTLGCPGYSQAPADEEKLAKVIRDNGCSMTEAQAEAILPAMGFTEPGVEMTIEKWKNDGSAEITKTGITLHIKGCP